MHLFRYTLAFLIVPTIIFAALKYHFFIIRGLVNIDYILAGSITAWLGPILGGLAFALAFLFDIMVSFAPAFHFKEGGFLESVSELMDIERDYVLFVASVIILTTFIYSKFSVKLAGKSHRRFTTGIFLILLVITCVIIDAYSTGNALNKGDTAHIQTNIATSSSFESLRNLYRWSRHTPPEELKTIEAATDPLRSLITQAPEKLPRNIVLVVVESWGLFNDKTANELQTAVLNDPQLQNRYKVTVADVPFFYSTVPGELRELCGVMMPTIDPVVDSIPGSRCLTQQLSKLGFRTLGAHGFAGNFFNRQNWYPDLGFDEALFARDLDAQLGKRRRCGVAFSGLCDADVMDILHNRLLSSGPNERQFLYWLTLNGHTPFPEPDERYPKLDCQRSQPSTEYESVCRLMAIQNVVLSAAVETAIDPALPETAFILVGDHAPPFVEQETRRLFSHERVPYAIFWPRKAASIAKP